MNLLDFLVDLTFQNSLLSIHFHIDMEIGIGTAQFGLDYGITNDTGIIPELEQVEIIRILLEAGFLYIDTAPSYGDAEERLGRIFSDLKVPLRIVTKGEFCSDTSLEKQLEESLERLKVDRVYGFLIHDFHKIPECRYRELRKYITETRRNFACDKIGASLYSVEELNSGLKLGFLDLIQIPVNVLDQRFIQSRELESARTKGMEIHARSLFLQGVLLKEGPSSVPALESEVEKFHSSISSLHLSRLEACWAFARATKIVDVWIMGVQSKLQFEESLKACRNAKAYEGKIDFSVYSSGSSSVDPRTW